MTTILEEQAELERLNSAMLERQRDYAAAKRDHDTLWLKICRDGLAVRLAAESVRQEGEA